MRATDSQLYLIGQAWKEFKSFATVISGLEANQFEIKQNDLLKKEATELITALKRISREHMEHIASRDSIQFLQEDNQEHLKAVREQLEKDIETIGKYYTFEALYSDLFRY